MICLSQKLYENLLDYAIACVPYECCGYLLGQHDSLKCLNQVTQICKIPNIHTDPKHFFWLAPDGQLEALKEAKSQGLEIIGIFHSHPTSPAYPSQEDLKYIYDSRQSYCIISLTPNPYMASFRIEGKKIYRENIKF
ncbi:hypothetical protein BKH46_00435 [Helicobacter sp. 12S02634-8]|uniref:M67 family metallopeptidase n=1 Tax=Helicobacter sp. 12S02634-8 TaxID=1476199 RepID=UPI000BCC308C|nr:M67 family metallopeptidase [Helicobacter sp. 12S02634-8]PAF48415.1 hypothetical protein BKH46_00435 [Helicobacter sp. 12S02634-8]